MLCKPKQWSWIDTHARFIPPRSCSHSLECVCMLKHTSFASRLVTNTRQLHPREREKISHSTRFWLLFIPVDFSSELAYSVDACTHTAFAFVFGVLLSSLPLSSLSFVVARYWCLSFIRLPHCSLHIRQQRQNANIQNTQRVANTNHWLTS